jgi:MFS family permease
MHQPAGGFAPHDPYSALREPSCRLFLTGNTIASLGYLMKDTAILWEVYARTDSKLQLGFVGLLQALPVVALPLLTGHLADRFNRKRIMAITLVLLAAVAMLLAINSLWIHSMPVLYGCLLTHGTLRAVQQPARQSLLPQIVSPAAFPNAVTWGSGLFHLAQVLGPILAGVILYLMHTAWLAYAIYAVLLTVFFFMLMRVEHRPLPPSTEVVTWRSLTGGLQFFFQNKVLLTVMSIDLFAVLLGGATGLMPVFQKDILQVSPFWLGILRAAPAMGAVGISVLIAHRPPFVKAGRAMLLAVAGYALAIIVFGMSEILLVSVIALFVSGMCDIVSVVVRHTMIQTLTPDRMRGRVSAINGMFIGASNYLGDAEAGYVAHLFGPQFSVISGGIGSLLVALVAAMASPQLRTYGAIGFATDPAPEEPPAT